MKVYIIAAITADGFIAKTSKEYIDWTSKEDKLFFREMTKKSGVIVLGGNTFRTFKKLLPGRRHIIYTHQKIDNPQVETTKETPEALAERLAKEGFNEIAICGGSTIYNMFLSSGVVSDVYLTVEPLLFGSGIKLAVSDLDIKLKLQSVKHLNIDTIVLHYKVVN